ncbi:hypothetical protein RJ640_008574 [Escallonia rubra]|uniref:Uncharacterized protein n=1 Tax=Escallonia rubra TaxID=112253 RepID=A0AA88QXG2_9ASTE|nr:hypothetical protein RJ640_008574 [Escallonia rubra]
MAELPTPEAGSSNNSSASSSGSTLSQSNSVSNQSTQLKTQISEVETRTNKRARESGNKHPELYHRTSSLGVKFTVPRGTTMEVMTK